MIRANFSMAAALTGVNQDHARQVQPDTARGPDDLIGGLLAAPPP